MDSLKGLLDKDMFAFYEAAGKYATNEGIKEYFLNMGRSAENEAKSCLKNLIQYMIKVKCQPSRLSASWLTIIKNSYDNLIKSLDNSPSLLPKIRNEFNKIFNKAINDAKIEMQINPYNDLPKEPIWTIDELIDYDFIIKYIIKALDHNQNPMFDAAKYSI